MKSSGTSAARNISERSGETTRHDEHAFSNDACSSSWREDDRRSRRRWRRRRRCPSRPKPRVWLRVVDLLRRHADLLHARVERALRPERERAEDARSDGEHARGPEADQNPVDGPVVRTGRLLRGTTT